MSQDHSPSDGETTRQSSQPFWHAQDPESVLQSLQSGTNGLEPEEAERRLAAHGPNTLTPPHRKGPFERFLLQFHNVLIYALIAAAIVTALLGHLLDTGVILGVVLINAIIGFIQEGKAEKALDAIRGMLSLKAVVTRGGRRLEIEAERLVPGDVVTIQSGDKVPADLRLIRVRNLRVEEAALTGESEGIEKQVGAVASQADLGDRRCMAYSGTLVSYGQATGVVVATGDDTQIGRISTMLREVETLTTPLLRKMASFARWLTVAIFCLAGFAFAYGVLFGGYSAREMFLASVGLAVAAIPEGLPAIMTITLAIGVQFMSRRNAIIRRLPAVETLGAVTVICSDKTGTLTRNEMSVQRIMTADRWFTVEGVGYGPDGEVLDNDQPVTLDDYPPLASIGQVALLCNDAELGCDEAGRHVVQGDPTEGALLALGQRIGLDRGVLADQVTRTDSIPFESEHRFMATLNHDHEGAGFVLLKGAPERVLGFCACQRTADGDVPLDRAYWEERMAEAAEEGLRVLALARCSVDSSKVDLTFDDIEQGGFVMLGMVGISDPPRAEAIEAVARCHEAGVRVIMITGDHAVTARAIARQLGVGGNGKVMTGAEVEGMDEAALREAVADCDVFARASPEHKLRLVSALQARGEVVAMTGDGVNDAPALKRADVGVAMGQKGTEAAKEAAEMVLADDNFASITHAVEEGRTVYDNLRKSIVFILPTNGGQAGIIVAAILLGLTLPILPAQILWVNMVTAVTLALALAFERPEAGVMARPPRDPDEPLLNGFLIWRTLFVSVLLVIGALSMFMWMQAQGMSDEVARTVAVNTLIFGEIFYLFNCRYLRNPVFSRAGLFGNRYVLMAIGVMLVLQMLFTYAPFMNVWFRTAPIPLEAWAAILVFGLAVFVAVEIEKRFFR
ncbi:MAG: cation-transporting P-type ATPase [Halothiobacillaceae bacterium]